jgi:membrane protease YdiL (CAAX protease family)
LSAVSAPLPLPPLPLPVGGPAYLFDPGMVPYAVPSYGPWAVARPPRVWPVFVVILITMVVGFFLGAVLPFMFLFSGGPVHFGSAEEFRDALMATITRPVVLLTCGAATQLSLIFGALSAAYLSPVPLLRRLRLTASTLRPLGYLIAPIGALAISYCFSMLVALLKIHPSGTLKLLDDAFQHLTPLEVFFAVLIVGVTPGFAEEFLFRGYAQTRLVQRWGRWTGIFITAVMFGLMHMDKLQSPFAAVFGVYLGYLAEKSGSIRPTMFCHAINNSVMIILGRFGDRSGTQEESATILVICLTVGLVVLVLCTAYIRYCVHPPRSEEPPAFDLIQPIVAFPPAPLS